MWHDVQQNTPEWDLLRVDKITMSELKVVMANMGKSFGEPARTYASDIALGQITGEVQTSGYYNNHMKRGHEQEPDAITEYEDRYFCVVTDGGFYSNDDVGCSPDGLVGSDGMIEAKSAIAKIHYVRVKRQDLDPSHKWQCIGNLKLSGRSWLDFISYCADYPEGKRIFVYRLWRENYTDEFQMIDDRLAEFRKLIEEAKANILDSNYSIGINK